MKKLTNTHDLRVVLFDEIQQLHSGGGDIKRAKTISSLAGTVLSSAKLDLVYAKAFMANKSKRTIVKALEFKKAA